jgi:hypothetical protein
MPVSADFDVQAFQSKVLWWIERHRKLRESELFYRRDVTYDTYKNSFERLGCLATLVVKPVLALQQYLSSYNYQKLKRDRESLARRAQQLLSQAEVKSTICPSLEGVRDDPREIAETIIRVLVSEARADGISAPLEADLFAMCALMIARLGATKFCVGEPLQFED